MSGMNGINKTNLSEQTKFRLSEKIEIENYLHQEINHRKSNKCSGSCSNINNPLAKVCVPDVVKNLNAKVFNLVSGTNETRRIECHETCKCKRTLHHIVCNNTLE